MENPKADARLLWIALTAIVIVLFVVTNRYAPPEALPANTAPAKFSADRGFTALQRVLSPEESHSTGSAANHAVRARILEELKSLGYTPHVHSAFVCRNGTCGHVRNVVTRVRGRQTGNAVMLAVHYDSVLAGPGASDDGQGLAATLEIARALKHRSQPLHDIILLIDDGEEWGLLGAEAFIRDHPWADGVRYAVIVESRGTTGPSLMFETAPGNRGVIDLMAAALERPVTNSIYYTIYKMLPNDTDFTVFKAAGLEGANFANSFGAARYHTPRDDLAHFDRRTLQHHGDNALAMVTSLADGDLRATPAVDAVFFDLLALQLIRWNEESTPPIAGAALAILVILAIVLIRQGRLRVTSILWGAGGFLVAVGAAALLGFVMLHFLRATGAVPVNWIARPSAMLIAFWLAPLSAVAFSVALVGRRAGSAGMWVAIWIFWAVGGLVLSFLHPGLTYPFVISASVAALAGVPWVFRRNETTFFWAVCSLLPLIVAAVLLFPLATQLYEGIGSGVMGVTSALVGVVLTGLSPLMAEVRSRWRWLIGAGAAAAMIAAVMIAASRVPFSVDNPQALSVLLHYDDDQKRAQWLLDLDGGEIPSAMRHDLSFSNELTSPLPWDPTFRAHAAPATAAFSAPQLEILQTSVPAVGLRRIRAILRSARGASVAGIIVPRTRIRSMTIDGRIARPNPRSSAPMVSYRHISLPEHGTEIDMTVEGPDPLEVILFDRSELPLSSAPWIAQRPSWAVPAHGGDRILVTRRTRI